MISMERINEMQEKFKEVGKGLATADKTVPIVVNGQKIGIRHGMKLEFSMLDILVSVGVAKDEDEAADFLTSIMNGLHITAESGQIDQFDAYQELLKTGFYVGLLAGVKTGTAN
jgi:hypothetical protein